MMFFMSGASVCRAQQKLTPQQFEAHLEQYIVTQAGLTPSESVAFFPLYREMRHKQMAYFSDFRSRHIDPTNDEACEKAIRSRDDNEVQIKMLQQTYHNRFLQVLPASKVLKVISAEDRFHRDMLSKLMRHDRKGKRGKPQAQAK